MAFGEEARVRVRIDTRQAKADLRDLGKDAAATGGRVSGGIRSALSTGLRASGVGAAAGAAFGAVRGAVSGGLGDTTEALLLPLKSLIDNAIGGPETRADMRALNKVEETFARATTANGGVPPPGAEAFFQHVRSLTLDEEKGRAALRDEFGGDIAERIATRIGEKMAEVMKHAMDNFWSTAVFGGLGSSVRKLFGVK